MDDFLYDVLDVNDAQVFQALLSDAGNGSSLDMTKLLSHPILLANIAFHNAWYELVGLHAPRIVFAHFRSHGLDSTLKEFSHFYVHQPAFVTDAVKNGSNTMARYLQRPAVTMHEVCMKLARRYNYPIDSLAPPVDTLSALVVLYVKMVTQDPLMAVACGTVDSVAVNNPAEYRAKVVECRERLSYSFLTKHKTLRETDFTACGTMSVHEWMVFAMLRDRVWITRDAGGSILVMTTSFFKKHVDPDFGVTVRVVHCDAAALPHLVRMIPRSLYQSVYVVSSEKGLDDGHLLNSLVVMPEAMFTTLVPSSEESYGVVGSQPPWMQSLRHHVASSIFHLPSTVMKMMADGRFDQLSAQGKQLAASYSYIQFVVRYLRERQIGRQVYATIKDTDAPNAPEKFGELIVIETRCNPMTVASLLITLKNLKPSRWGVTVLCSMKNILYMHHCLRPHVPNVTCALLSEVCGQAVLKNQVDGEERFTIQTYNAILKSVGLWKYLSLKAERVLLIQDDALIVREGLEDDVDLARYDYIGAPWDRARTQHVQLLQMHGVGDNLVGNGGLSLRRTKAMLEIVETQNDAKLELFGYNSQIIPEDVYFSKHIKKTNQCPTEIAQRFAFEMTAPSPTAYGFHKPWMYHDLTKIHQLFCSCSLSAT